MDTFTPDPINSEPAKEPVKQAISGISQKDMLFLLSCYCYYHAALIGQEALKALNPALVIVDSIHSVKKADELVANNDALEKELMPEVPQFVDTTVVS
jgi:hypothetical protein